MLTEVTVCGAAGENRTHDLIPIKTNDLCGKVSEESGMERKEVITHLSDM